MKFLLALFIHPMSQIRVQTIWALRAKKHRFTETIREMVNSGTRLERLSA